MAERKVYTEKQKDEIKRRRDERNAATKALITAVLSVGVEGEVTSEIVELAKLAQPKTSAGTGTSKVSVMSKVKELFEDNTEIDEVTVFTELHLGRPEMATAIKNLIKKPSADERLWINFDVDNGVYILEGRGAEAPAGWTGFVPVEEVIED